MLTQPTNCIKNLKGCYVYIVQTVNGKFYCGITQHLVNRMLQHVSANKGFLSRNRVHHICYLRMCSDRRAARRVEVRIKHFGPKRFFVSSTVRKNQRSFIVHIPLTFEE